MEFENGGFTLKTAWNVFCPRYAGGIWKRNNHRSFLINPAQEITWLSWRHRFRTAPFSKCFLSALKRKASVFRFLRFEERFWKAPFSWRISVDGRSNRRKNAAFSDSLGVEQNSLSLGEAWSKHKLVTCKAAFVFLALLYLLWRKPLKGPCKIWGSINLSYLFLCCQKCSVNRLSMCHVQLSVDWDICQVMNCSEGELESRVDVLL